MDYAGEIENAVDKNKSAPQTVDGVPYDYVWDVDLGDGVPTRHIGYNVGQNPYMVAQEFILKYELPQTYLDQIAKFIIKNSAQSPPSGGGSYSQQQQPQQQQPKPQSQAPAPGGIPLSKSKLFPQVKPLLFESSKPAQFDGPLGKIKQFNSQLPPGDEAALGDKDVVNLDIIFNKLKQTSRYHTSTFLQDEFSVIGKLLKWPQNLLWPVLDFIRMFVLHPEGAKYFLLTSNNFSNLLDLTAKMSKSAESNDTNDKSSLCVSLLFKTISNIFMFESLRTHIVNFEERILDLISDSLESSPKATLLALSTTLLNFSVLYLISPSEKGIPQVLSLIDQALKHKEADPDILIRLLVALGTLIYSKQSSQQLAWDLGLDETLQGLGAPSENVKVCVEDILSLKQ